MGHSFTYCSNMERDVLIFASLLSFCIFSTFLAPAAGPGGGPRWWSDCPAHRPERSPPLPVAACRLFSPEHTPPGDSPSLPSSPPCFPLRCSFSLGSALCWWSALCSAVLPLRLSRCELWRSAGGVVYGSIFFFYSTAPGINACARVRAGGGLSCFFALCGAAGGVFLWGLVSGYSFDAVKAWRGVSVRFLYFRR